MISEERLNALFSEAGKELGYDNVQAEYMAFKDIKVRWQRSYRWANFKVSDYLSEAPETVMKALCNSLFTKIVGQDDSYPHELRDWVTAPEFASSNQPVYLKRSRNLTKSTAGEHKDLEDSRRRLLEAGLIDDDPAVYLSWSKEASSRKTGSCSMLMKVISISKHLDRPEVPDHVLDLCLYDQFCNVQRGFDPDGDGGGEDEGRGRSFPQADEAKEWLLRSDLMM